MGANWPATKETPHMDALANSGLRFTDFHAMSLCTPSRAALMTGRFGLRTGVVTNFSPYSKFGLPLNETTLAERLRPSGYRTGMTGKWHLGMANGHRPTLRGFDFWFGLPLSHDYGCTDHQVANFTYGAGWEYNSSPEGGCDPCPHSGPSPAAAPNAPSNVSCNIGANNRWHISPPLFENEQIIEQPVDERYLSPKYAKAAIEFIKGTAPLSADASATAADPNAPFFLYMAFSHMHTPQHHSSDWDGKSRRKGSHYGDTLAQLDDTIGQVVAAIDSMGIGNGEHSRLHCNSMGGGLSWKELTVGLLALQIR
jgi:arylsulfatase G